MKFGEKDITVEKLYRNFEVLRNWEDRYKYVISLGRQVPVFPEEQKIDDNYVHGCSSRVWMIVKPGQQNEIFEFLADSDSAIVKGLIAVLMIVYENKGPKEILHTDVESIFKRLDLGNHLSATRANGFFAMVKKIKMLAVEQAARQNFPQ